MGRLRHRRGDGGGGFLASDPTRCERIVGAGFGIAAALALVLAFASFPPVVVPVLFKGPRFCLGCRRAVA